MGEQAFNFKIVKRIAVIGRGIRGGSKEVNMVSWNGGEAKLDIRYWDEDHKNPGNGISIRADELVSLKAALDKVEPF